MAKKNPHAVALGKWVVQKAEKEGLLSLRQRKGAQVLRRLLLQDGRNRKKKHNRSNTPFFPNHYAE
jgi:hypothetical protein